MRNIKIQQNSVPEVVTRDVITSLYKQLSDPENTSAKGDVSGYLVVDYASKKEVEYLRLNYDLTILITEEYTVDISDPVLELIFIEKYSGGKGYLTKSDFNSAEGVEYAAYGVGSEILKNLQNDSRWNSIQEIDLRFLSYLINCEFTLPTSCKRVLLNRATDAHLVRWSKEYAPNLEYVYLGECGNYAYDKILVGGENNFTSTPSEGIVWVINSLYPQRGGALSANSLDKFSSGLWNFPVYININDLYFNADILVTQKLPTYGQDQKESIDNNTNNAWTDGSYTGKITNLYVPQSLLEDYTRYYSCCATNVIAYDFDEDTNNVLP